MGQGGDHLLWASDMAALRRYGPQAAQQRRYVHREYAASTAVKSDMTACVSQCHHTSWQAHETL